MKGKKTSKELIYKIMISVFNTGNLSETARFLNLPVTTVKNIYDRNKDKEEFVKLGKEKKDEFIKIADRIIQKGTELLEKRLDLANKHEDELEELIDEIWATDKSEMNETKKKALVNKVQKLQLNNLGEITTAIGTLYDKKALAKGEPTANETITINIGLTDEC